MQLLEKYFADFSDKQKQQFAALPDLYADWNSKINVISRKDMEAFMLHHVLHSLAIAAVFELKPGGLVADLGSGGGFPGIPLAIFFPETEFLLVDSIGKKLKVSSEIAAAIGLDNVAVQHARIEDIKNKKFDTIVSRAVAPLKDLWHWSRPLIQKLPGTNDKHHPNGLICLKGGDLTQEVFESGTKPKVWQVNSLFPEEYFKEKFVLYVPR